MTFSVGASAAIAAVAFPLLVLLGWMLGPLKTTSIEVASAPSLRDEVRRVSIGFDATARRDLQATLDEMADTMPMITPEDMRAAAEQLARTLSGALSSARYFTYQSLSTRGDDTERTFRRWTYELAARYQHERDHDASGLTARSDEGEGLVVVSVVLATGMPMRRLPDATDPAAMQAAVESMTQLPRFSVQALEVIWSPAEELDRMSSLELEQLYPELQRLDDGLAFGRVACGYCRAPYPAELGTCPACGAPAPSAT